MDFSVVKSNVMIVYGSYMLPAWHPPSFPQPGPDLCVATCSGEAGLGDKVNPLSIIQLSLNNREPSDLGF